ncbi:hypothetical protein HRbin17_02685 [bacterium HR17]|uniref:Uncharacterized protein n=1 Tax=Candidatus Fervidibacter japonicus TaxID=2035412 RepID=A0A2H5XG63_9BACT|nr:hypothetical protein HRbin17_02685 [bacterium HR17]
MQKEVPAWVAAVIIVVVLLLVGGIYLLTGRIRPVGEAMPTPETVKQRMMQNIPRQTGERGMGSAPGMGGHGPMGRHGRPPNAPPVATPTPPGP